MHPPSFAITLEEHATLEALGDESDFYSEIWKTFPEVRNRLRDFSSARLADMNAGHVKVQVISALPGMASVSPSGCRAANDELAMKIAEHPKRFAGFAALPMSRPEEAATELERAVTKLGFVGAMIDNHSLDGTHYDDKWYWPVFGMAQRLDVPIYIHPAPPALKDGTGRFAGNFSKVVSMGVSTGAWGWHENVGLHVVKLFAAGLFREFPDLKIVIGHMGEMLPMMIDRLDRLRFFEHGGVGKFSDVWNRNIWVTSSGIFSIRTLKMLMQVASIDRMMFSVDTPFEQSGTGWKFLEELADSDVLTEEQVTGFAYGNAQKLFKLDQNMS